MGRGYGGGVVAWGKALSTGKNKGLEGQARNNWGIWGTGVGVCV